MGKAGTASDGRRSRHRRYGALDTGIPRYAQEGLHVAAELNALAKAAGVSTGQAQIPLSWKHAARDVTQYANNNRVPPYIRDGLAESQTMTNNAITVIHPDDNKIVPILPVYEMESAEMALARQADFVNAIARRIDEVFEEGIHYGIIPGTTKFSLYKAGAEEVLGLLGLRAFPTPIEIIRKMDKDDPFFYYEMRVDLVHIQSGQIVATGEGSCNSRESQYMRNQNRTCPRCGKETIYKSNKNNNWFCWGGANGKGGCGAQFAINDESIIKQEVGSFSDPQLVWDSISNIQNKAIKRATAAATKNVAMLSSKLAEMSLVLAPPKDGQGSGQNQRPNPSPQAPQSNSPAPSASQTSGQEPTYNTWIEVPANKDRVIALLNEHGLPKDYHKVLMPESTGWVDLTKTYKSFDELKSAIEARINAQVESTSIETKLTDLHVKPHGKSNQYSFKTASGHTVTAFTREAFREAGWIASGAWDKVTTGYEPLAEAIPVTITQNDKGFWQIQSVHPAPDFFEEDVPVPQDAPKQGPRPSVYGQPKPSTPQLPAWADTKFMDWVEMTAAMTPEKALNEMERTGWHEFANADEARIAVHTCFSGLPDLRYPEIPADEDIPF